VTWLREVDITAEQVKLGATTAMRTMTRVARYAPAVTLMCLAAWIVFSTARGAIGALGSIASLAAGGDTGAAIMDINDAVDPTQDAGRDTAVEDGAGTFAAEADGNLDSDEPTAVQESSVAAIAPDVEAIAATDATDATAADHHAAPASGTDSEVAQMREELRTMERQIHAATDGLEQTVARSTGEAQTRFGEQLSDVEQSLKTRIAELEARLAEMTSLASENIRLSQDAAYVTWNEIVAFFRLFLFFFFEQKNKNQLISSFLINQITRRAREAGLEDRVAARLREALVNDTVARAAELGLIGGRRDSGETPVEGLGRANYALSTAGAHVVAAGTSPGLGLPSSVASGINTALGWLGVSSEFGCVLGDNVKNRFEIFIKKN
jgi:hypothetical protein